MNHAMSYQDEVAFAFSCQGDELIGFLHKGDPDCDIGVLALVAGGPQYRGGVGRQLVNLGRRLASEGIPVMRFDYRGVGDSEGIFNDFLSIQDDIAAAIEQFKRQAPNVRGVILWGGCNAGTAALINAHKFPDVIGAIAVNPFVSSSAIASKATRMHYLSRLKQASFWKKLARLEYNPAEYLGAALRKTKGKMLKTRNSAPERKTGNSRDGYLDQLLRGLRNFDGKVLFLMGSSSLIRAEFDSLMGASPEWRSAYRKSNYDRIDIKGGNQLFSTKASQELMFDAASEWVHRAFPERVMLKSPTDWRQNSKLVDGQTQT